VPSPAARKALNAIINVSATRTLFTRSDKDFTCAQSLAALRAIEQDIVVLIS
jgi:hypothetical protein